MNSDDCLRETISGGVWIFLGSTASSLIGFLFWFVITWLTGAKIVGIASSVASSAYISANMICAGINIAVMREIAASGEKAFTSALFLAATLGAAAAVIAIPLTLLLGYGNLCPLASILAGAGVLSVVLRSSLIGFEKFRSSFVALLSGSVVKLVLGAALVALGLGAEGALLGYASMPVVVSIMALLLLLPNVKDLDLSELKELVSLSISNYPYVFSNQTVVMLSVYLFAYLTGKEILTGILYISLMIVLAMASVSNSVLNAALPIGTRRDVDPFVESFRIGLGMVTPVLVLILPLSGEILRILNLELLPGSDVLRILLLSTAPFSVITAITMKLNKEKRKREISSLGSLRLILLAVLLPVMAEIWDVEGAALAFLLANAVPTLAALRYDQTFSRYLLIFWSLHLFAYVMSIFTAVPLAASILSLTVTFAIMQLSKSLTLKEIKYVLALAASSVRRGDRWGRR